MLLSDLVLVKRNSVNIALQAAHSVINPWLLNEAAATTNPLSISVSVNTGESSPLRTDPKSFAFMCLYSYRPYPHSTGSAIECTNARVDIATNARLTAIGQNNTPTGFDHLHENKSINTSVRSTAQSKLRQATPLQNKSSLR